MRWLGRGRRPKIFCIGSNKTGTTSLGAALSTLGFRVGRQSRAERLIEDWGRRDFRRLIRYCHSADAFQDVPFSLPFTYIPLDQAFPGSRFILTVRDDEAQWFRSLTDFHTEIVGKGRLPTVDDLRQFGYQFPGYLWRVLELTFGGEGLVYDYDRYTAVYLSHIQSVTDYFSQRSDHLLVLNLADVDAPARLCRFLGLEGVELEMPHLNRGSRGN